MKQLPYTVLRVVQEFEDAVQAKAMMTPVIGSNDEQHAKNEYTVTEYVEAKKGLLNMLREMLGMELLP